MLLLNHILLPDKPKWPEHLEGQNHHPSVLEFVPRDSTLKTRFVYAQILGRILWGSIHVPIEGNSRTSELCNNSLREYSHTSTNLFEYLVLTTSRPKFLDPFQTANPFA